MIGILTFQDTTNFGATLQAFALTKCVQSLGYEAELINYQSPNLVKREIPVSKWQYLKSTSSLKSKVRYLLFGQTQINKRKKLFNFIKTNAAISKEYNPESIVEANKIYDKIIVGSDMVWNLDITNRDFNYMLSFAGDNVYKASFASSVGKIWQNEEDGAVKKLLSKFSKISAREESSKKLIKERCNLDVAVVCDPTLLLTGLDWKNYCKQPRISKEYVLVYFDDEESKCLSDAIEYGKINNLPVYYINTALRSTKGYRNIWIESIEYFLGLIKNADAVFTASYHGMLFSLYFNKNLYWYNRAEKERMLFAAKKFNVEHRNGKEYNWKSMQKIDYEVTNSCLAEYRNESLLFLKSILKDN